MNRGILSLIAFLLTVTSTLDCRVQAAEKKENASQKAVNDSGEPDYIEDRWVVILGVYNDFAEAKADAKKFAAVSKVPFTMDGRIFDKKGLRYPDGLDDEAFQGQYIARRYNTSTIKGLDVTEYLSVEKSDGYEDLKPGYYIVVGSIAESAAHAKQETARFLSASKHTYFKKTRLYMGCLH